MSTDEQAFLAKILAEPNDDTHRLVYADWLDENGRHERAEFIRAQVKLASLGSPPPKHHHLCREGTIGSVLCSRCEWLAVNAEQAASLESRAWEIWKANYANWEAAPGATNHFTRGNLRRGFVEEMCPTTSWWIAHGDAMLAHHPVAHVRLTMVPNLDDFEAQYPNMLPYRVYLKLAGKWVTVMEDAWTIHQQPNEAQRAIVRESFPLRWPRVTFEFPS